MNIRKKLIKMNILLFMILVTCIAIVITFGVSKNETKIINVQKREIFATSGTCGTCSWTIDNNGKLTIGAGTLKKIDYQEHPNWYSYRSSIKSVYVNSGVKTNTSCFALFQDCTNLVSADISNLNASNCKKFCYTFDGCSKLESVKWGSNIITTNTASFNHCFQYCGKLKSLDLSGCNTTNCTEMENLFFCCYNLETINFGSHFSTAKNENFNCMFGNCQKLKSIGIRIDTSSANKTNSATDCSMSTMFYMCQALTSINLSGFSTSKVTSMRRMFCGCKNLKTLDLSTFNTSSVTEMSQMLEGLDSCNKIIFGSSFRFKKSGTNTNKIIKPNYRWKKQGTSTVYTALTLENQTGAVTGTWLRQFEVVYKGNGGTWNNTNTWSNYATYSETYSVESNFFTRKGYTFSGWSTNSNNTNDGYGWTGWSGTWSYSEGQYGISGGKLILYARWTAKKYKVTYKGNGGTWNNTNTWSENVLYGHTYKVQANFYTRKGYTFAGWKDPTGASWTGWSGTWSYDNGDYGITNNELVLTAQWTPTKYTVTYRGNGGIWNNTDTWSNTATYGQSYTIEPTFYTRKGYTFAGWTTNANGTDDGYNWTSWSGTWSYDNGQYGIANNKLVLYARWTPKTYTVTYKGNGGTWSNTDTWSNTITYGQLYTVRENFYTKPGNAFVGWTTNSNGTDDGYNWTDWSGYWVYDNGDYGITNNALTLYARWTTNAANISVNHYIHNLGSNTYTLHQNVTSLKVSGSTVYLSSLKKNIPGFTYDGGYITGNTTRPTSSPVTTTTVLADGSRVINLYYRRNYLYVQYNVNGGTMASEHDASIYGIDNSTIVFNGNEHYNLRGVYGSTVGGIHENTYEVNTNGLHDYNNPDSINIVRSGYKAVENEEWYILNNQNKTTYDQSITTYNANDMAAAAGKNLADGDVIVTLYVNWVLGTYSLTYNANGGTVNPSGKTVTFSEQYGDLAIPEKPGNTFDGWSRLPNGYKELEYIESTGTQYIDTGYMPNPETGIKVDYQYTDLTQQQSVFAVYGDDSNSLSFSYALYINYLTKLAYAYKDGTGNWMNTGIDADTERHIWEFNVSEHSWNIDNGNITPVEGSATNTAINSMCIMASKNLDNTVSYHAKMKLYDFEIYENGVLIKKFIPCKNSMDVIGLYEIIGNQFYSNSGTGTFSSGNEKYIQDTDIVSLPYNHTLNANWIKHKYKIEYYEGNANSNIEELAEPITKLGESICDYDEPINLSSNSSLGVIEPKGWRFAGWSENNGVESTSVTYTDCQSVTKLVNGTTDINNVYVSEADLLNGGDYVNYIDSNGNTILCRVLYDKETVIAQNGVQIISAQSIANIELNGNTECNIELLNNYERSRLNTSIATDVRTVGSRPDNPSYCDQEDSTKNYTSDVDKMVELGIANIGSSYWLGSEEYDYENYDVYYYDSAVHSKNLGYEVQSPYSYTSYSGTYGYRPVYTLSDNIIIVSGDGSAGNPYVLYGFESDSLNSIVKLYAIFERDINLYSGNNCNVISNKKQYFNTNNTELVSEVQSPMPSITGFQEYGWNAIGYRIDTEPQEEEFSVTTQNMNIKPEYDFYNPTDDTLTTINLYGVYSRTIDVYHGLNKANHATPIQYLNTFENRVSEITVPAPSVEELSNNGWETSGYRADTQAIDVSN